MLTNTWVIIFQLISTSNITCSTIINSERNVPKIELIKTRFRVRAENLLSGNFLCDASRYLKCHQQTNSKRCTGRRKNHHENLSQAHTNLIFNLTFFSNSTWFQPFCWCQKWYKKTNTKHISTIHFPCSRCCQYSLSLSHSLYAAVVVASDVWTIKGWTQIEGTFRCDPI